MEQIYEKIQKAFDSIDFVKYIENCLTNNINHEFIKIYFENNQYKLLGIPEENIRIGEICNLSHGEFEFKPSFPVLMYFQEVITGSLNEGFVRNDDEDRIGCLIDGIIPKTMVMERPNRWINFMISSYDLGKVKFHQLNPTMGEGGDPFYFLIDIKDLPKLCKMVTEKKSYSDYAKSWVEDFKSNIKKYGKSRKIASKEEIEEILNSFISDVEIEYHWWDGIDEI